MELIFLKKNTKSANRFLKLTAALYKNGQLVLSRKCSEEFNLGTRFLFGKIAIDQNDQNFKNISTFYFVEEMDNKVIENDKDIIKMSYITMNKNWKLGLSNLSKTFESRFKSEKASIRFKVNYEKIKGHNVLTFNLITE